MENDVPIKSAESDEIIIKEFIGKGAFSEVYLVTLKKDPEKLYAMKKVKKSILENYEIRRHFRYELTVLSQLKHENIILLNEVKKTEENYLLLFEYCNGNNLKEILKEYIKKNNKPFTEDIVQYLLKQMLHGLDYLHNKLQIIHRDLKLENILIKYNSDEDKEKFNLLNCQVKITDFGSAKKITNTSLATTVIGTPFNMSPQILLKKNEIEDSASIDDDDELKFQYDFKADIYSLGTVTYEMLLGVRPFEATSAKELYDKELKGVFNLPNNYEDIKISQEAIDFLVRMLTFDATKRNEVNDLIIDPFIVKNFNDFSPITKPINIQLNESLNKHNDGPASSQDSLAVCDYLNLGNEYHIKKWIRNEKLFYSVNIYKINKYGYKQKRIFIITSEAIYHFDKQILKSFYLIQFLNGISLSALSMANPLIVIHSLDTHYDYYYQTPGKNETIELIRILGIIYKHKTGNDLKIFLTNKNSLKSYVTTAKERQKDMNFSRVNEKEEYHTYTDIIKLMKGE